MYETHIAAIPDWKTFITDYGKSERDQSYLGERAIVKWCWENNITLFWLSNGIIMFKNEEDAMAFKLRWL